MEIISSIIKAVIENPSSVKGRCVQFPSLSPDENFYYIQNCLKILSWNFGNVDNISLKTFWHPQFVTLKYLRMRELKYVDVIYNLLTNFSIEKGSSIFFQLPDI